MNWALKELIPGAGKIYGSGVSNSVRERDTRKWAQIRMIYLMPGCKSDVVGHTGSSYPPTAPPPK